METKELAELISKTQPKTVKFDGCEFVFEFHDGLIVTVGITTNWDSAVYEIDTNIEESIRNARYEKERLEEEARKFQVKQKEANFLNSLTQEQRDSLNELNKLNKRY